MRSEELQLLDGFRPEYIYEPTELDVIKTAAYNLIDSADRAAGAEFARNLEKMLSELRPNRPEEVRAVSVARYWLIRLKVFGFSCFSLGEQIRFFKQDALEVLRYGLDIGREILRYLDFYSPTAAKDFLRTFLGSLRENQSWLGPKPGGYTVADWLKLYQQSLNAHPIRVPDPSSVDVVSFINTNPKTRSLTPPEKGLLRNLLSLSNLLTSASLISVSQSSVLVADTVASRLAPSIDTNLVMRTTAPIELRDQSIQGRGPAAAPPAPGAAGGKILPPAPRPSPAAMRKPLPQLKPSLPEKKNGGEALFRSTLDELQKMRVTYEKAAPAPMVPIPEMRPKPVPPPSVRVTPPVSRPPIRPEPPPRPFSVNEAVARGRPNFNAEDQAAGLAPGKEIEDKLKQLQDKVK